MPKAQSASRNEKRPERRSAGLRINGVLLIFLAFILAVFVTDHRRFDLRYDFGTFYYAAHMVLDGSRNALDDRTAQHAFQTQFHRSPDMVFRNPPFALLPILPLAKLSATTAFILWTALSFAFLFVGLKILEVETGIDYGNWPMLLAPAFAPILANFLHGQFSLLVFCAYAATRS